MAQRKLTIFGSTSTPQYGVSAFQYQGANDIWQERIPTNTDIVVVHGPPHLHLDARDCHRAGCPYLTQELARVRPRLVVFGHIHAAYGREEAILDNVQLAYDDVTRNWAGWGTLAEMAIDVIVAKLKAMMFGQKKLFGKASVTTLVNASVVGGPKNELQNLPIVVEL